MTKAFDKVMAGLKDAGAYLRGARVGFDVHEIKLPELDVAATRGKAGSSQPAFAESIGVPLGVAERGRSIEEQIKGAV